MPIKGSSTYHPKDTQPSVNPEKNSEQIIQWQVVRPRYKMNDLILDNTTHDLLLDIISYFKNRSLIFDDWGLNERYSMQKGLAVNLYGPSGTGKTMAAHAIADAMQLSMICVDYAEIESKYVGETSKNLKYLFQTAEKQGTAIFFDEADALLSKRVTNMTSATDVSVNQTRSVLLNLLNDYSGVILLASNFLQNFDTAFLRRIKYHICFHLPDAALREKLWRMYIPEKMPCEADFAALAENFDGISGSDISNAVFTAAVRAAGRQEQVVRQCFFEEAIQNCIAVKKENQGEQVMVSKRILTKEEVQKKLGIKEDKE